MKLLNLFVLALLLCSNISLSQTNEELKSSALRDARVTSAATLAKDFNVVLNHTHPTVVNFMGGQEKALELVEQAFSGMEAQGLVFEKADVIAVSNVVFEQGEHRCYVENFNQFSMNGTRIKSKSFLLGFYDAEKSIWYFIEAAKTKDSALMDELFPEFKTSMLIPDDETTTEQIKN